MVTLTAIRSAPSRCAAALLVLVLVLVGLVTSLGSPPAAHAAPGSVADRDAKCATINTWLADHQYPERIDCTTLSTDPDEFCDDVDQAFTTAGLDELSYDCDTGTVTRAEGPTEQRDAACRAVNAWLANNNFPERIDCNTISNGPDKICSDIQQALRAAGVTIPYNCGTGSGPKPGTDDHDPPCPDDDHGVKGEKDTAPTAGVGLFGL
jgi:hypothetical protein